MRILISHCIFLLLWLPLMVVAQSASFSPPPVPLAEPSMAATALSDTQITNFEQRAMQKVSDFVEYSAIIGDNHYDAQLRQHALELTLKMFVADSIQVAFEQEASAEVAKMLIKEHLEILYDAPGKSKEVAEMGEVIFSKPLLPQNPQLYSGQLAFPLTLRTYNAENELLTVDKLRVEMEVYLTKVKKRFGSTVGEVWEVLLGEMVIRADK